MGDGRRPQPGGLVWAGPGGLLALALLGWGRSASLPAWTRRITGIVGAEPAPPVARAAATGSGPTASSGLSSSRESLAARWGSTTPANRVTAGAIAALVALGLFLVLRPGGFVETFNSALTGGDQIANLNHPLSLAQVAGIWLAGDFRATPSPLPLSDVLIVFALVAAAFALFMSVRAGRAEIVLYVACTLVGALLIFVFASPWLGGKGLATAAPAIPLAALTAVGLVARRRALAGAILGLLIAGGIVWSNALAYHDVWLAPRAQFTELAQIGSRIAGQGPTLVNEFQPYATHHFLRAADPESPSEARSRLDPLAGGGTVAKLDYADLDELSLGPCSPTARSCCSAHRSAAGRPRCTGSSCATVTGRCGSDRQPLPCASSTTCLSVTSPPQERCPPARLCSPSPTSQA